MSSRRPTGRWIGRYELPAPNRARERRPLSAGSFAARTARMLNDDQKWYSVSLRFFGEGLDVSSVAAKVGVKPDLVGRVGEHYRGNPRYALYETNLWVHRYTDADARPFCDQLTELITRLEERADSIRALTSAPGV